MKLSRYRSLPIFSKGNKKFAGRNSLGRITVRHRGKGHKQNIRSIQWHPNDEKGIVVGFEYDPQRTSPIAKRYNVSETDKKKKATFFYKIATNQTNLFQKITYSSLSRKNYGDQTEISNYEPGDFVHSVERYPGQGPSIARAAGSFCQIRSHYSQNTKYVEQALKTELFLENLTFDQSQKKKNSYRKIRLPSGSQRLISSKAFAVYGIPEFNGFHQKPRNKAGRSRWYGWRPSVRGVARNPVDHPHGGGQGKTSGGRPSVTFKSWPTKGQPTRSPKRKNAFILEPRKK